MDWESSPSPDRYRMARYGPESYAVQYVLPDGLQVVTFVQMYPSAAAAIRGTLSHMDHIATYFPNTDFTPHRAAVEALRKEATDD